MEQQPQQHLDGQSEHGEEEGHQDRILQQAHARVVFGVVTPEESVDQQTAHDKKAADYNGAENAFAPIRSDAENVRQVDVDLIDEAVVIPRLPGPEPLPAGSANEGADEDHRGQEFNAQQERPDVHFLRPSRLERPRFAVMRLGERRIAGELFDQYVIRMRLLPGQVHVEGQQRDHGDDRNVVRGGEDFPKLLPIHGYFFASFISESSTTAAGPEMPPSLRTRQKCRTMKIEAMMGMPMQCQM